MAKYKMGGFLFETEEEAQKAKKELDAIRYIYSQTKMNDPEVVLKLYNRLIEQNYFESPIGIEFLRDLQQQLGGNPQIKKESIPPIPIPNHTLELAKDERRAKHEAREKHTEEKKRIAEKKAVSERRYRKLFHVTLILAAMLAAMLIGIFVITYISGVDMNIYNYEQEIIDKYEAWDKELTQRETEVTEREKKLQSITTETAE